ncbi:hypothetical protein M3Y98_01086800 [Aphelenchoides besseyi]|nr:hypothetical protein M3Y98_01086800 [Aphelenchoides besseyi]
MAEDVLEAIISAVENADYLWCPICGDKLESTIIDLTTDEKSENNEQTIWWTCRGLRTKSCDFPLWIPKDVFWVPRTAKQVRDNVIPLPNFHLLPSAYEPLYPSLFKKPRRDRRIRPKKPVENVDNNVEQQKSTEKKTVSFDNRSTNNSNDEGNGAKKRVVEDANRRLEELASLTGASTTSTKLVRPSISELYSNVAQATHLPDGDMNNVEYGEPNSQHKVKLFEDQKRALGSLIALKFSGDTFISMLNSEMSRKKLVTPLPSLGQKQRLKLLSQQKRMKEKMTKEIQAFLKSKESDKELRRYLIDATKPKISTPEERQAADIAVQKCIDAFIVHQSYPTPNEAISMRLGTEKTDNEHETFNLNNKSLSWGDLGVLRNSQEANAEVTIQRLTNAIETVPPAASVSSTQSSERSTSSFPEGHPLHIKSMGDEELDNLVRTNLVGLIRTGKLKRRRKRKAKEKPQPIESQNFNTTIDDYGLTPINNEVPQNFGQSAPFSPHPDPMVDEFPNLDYYSNNDVDHFGFEV